MQDVCGSLATMAEYEQASLPIDRIVIGAILVAPMRLVEQASAAPLEVSRRTVRETLVRLKKRGPVQVRCRRGRFVVQPSVTLQAIVVLHAHIARQREARASHDISARSFLLGDLHLCRVEAFNNPVLV